MKVNHVKFLGVAGVIAAMFSACGGGGGNGGGYVSQAWFNVYGQYCGSSAGPGCDFYANGDHITYAEDPYAAPLEYGTYYYTDVYGYSQAYTGWARQTPDGIIFDENGNALNSTSTHGRDAATNAAVAQETAINAASQTLQANYGLSADVASNVAAALNDWAVLGKSRKRTDADVAAFTKRLSGLDITEVNAALQAASSGDMTAANQAISKAAANWSTSPDTMKQILRDWYQANIN